MKNPNYPLRRTIASIATLAALGGIAALGEHWKHDQEHHALVTSLEAPTDELQHELAMGTINTDKVETVYAPYAGYVDNIAPVIATAGGASEVKQIMSAQTATETAPATNLVFKGEAFLLPKSDISPTFVNQEPLAGNSSSAK